MRLIGFIVLLLLNIGNIYLIIRKLNINKKVKKSTLKFKNSRFSQNHNVFLVIDCSVLFFLSCNNIIYNINEISILNNLYTYCLSFSILGFILSLILINSKIGITERGILYIFKEYSWSYMDSYIITEDNEISIELKSDLQNKKWMQHYVEFKIESENESEILKILNKNIS